MRRIVKWFKGQGVIEIVEVDYSTGAVEFRPPSWQVRPVFAWYDFWVGIFVDREKRKVYCYPFPCIGFVIFWG